MSMDLSGASKWIQQTTKADVLVKLSNDDASEFTIIILQRTDDGLVVSGVSKRFNKKVEAKRLIRNCARRDNVTLLG